MARGSAARMTDARSSGSPRSDRQKHRRAALRASVSSDRSAQVAALGTSVRAKTPTKKGYCWLVQQCAFYGKGALGGGTGACFEIAERPPAASSNISVRTISDVPIHYSTVGVISSARSAEPSSGKLLR